MNDNFHVKLHEQLSVQFDGALSSIRTYYEKEFPGRLHNGKVSNPTVHVSFEALQVSGGKKIGARAITTSDEFYLLDGKGHVAKVDFAQLRPNATFHISADKEIHVRFLHQMVENFIKALAPFRGSVFVHSSGFRAQDKTVMIAAWAHTGKTNTLLSFLESGAKFYGDDWTIVSDGTLIPYPKTLNLFGYNLELFPQVKQKLPMTFKLVFGVTRFMNALLAPVARSASQLGHYASTLRDLVGNQGHVRLTLPELFPNAEIAEPAPLDLIILPQRNDGPVRADAIGVETFVDRMIPCLRFERGKLAEWYALYQFAFPGQTSEVMERLEETEREQLLEQLRDKKILAMDFSDGKLAHHERKRVIENLLS